MNETNTPLPIKDFKEAVIGIAALYIFGKEVAQSKKFDWNKAFVLSAKLNAGVEGYENILPQAFDIDSTEGLEVISAVSMELGLTSEAAKNVVLAVVEALPANLKLYKAIAAAV